jgi:hypothetical protein
LPGAVGLLAMGLGVMGSVRKKKRETA